MSEARSALVVGDAQGALGELALRLIRLGIDSFYAVDPAEAWLLAQQEAPRIGVLLFPPDIDPKGLAALLEVLSAKAPGVARALVAVGACPDEAVRERLRGAGVAWALWEPWDESALRMVLSAALSARPRPEGEPRRSPRLPTTLLARAYKGLQRKDAIVCSLSLGGAFLELPYPFEQGTQLTLEVEVGEGSIVVKAEVVYVREAGEGGRPEQPCGMGVAFRDLAPADTERLERQLAEQERRFVL
jgi:hypothetical protein